MIKEFTTFDGFKKIDGKNNDHIVQLITISTCIWCNRLKRLLNENSISYEYIDIDLLPLGEKNRLKQVLYKYSDILGFPMCFIDGYLIRGYKENEIMENLKGD
ncbi:MAG: glutaredoxin family protein [Candidatus Helarchaeota archaeon]